MSKFIEVNYEGQQALINLEKIMYMSRCDTTETEINLVDGASLVVKEKYENLISRLTAENDDYEPAIRIIK